VDIPHLGPTFGRHEFLIRRLHSLTGLVPIGAYLVIHLATNASILDGVKTFQERVDVIHSIGPTTLLLVEWAFIFLPILFHGLIGLLIVTRGQRNVVNYPYGGNVRYTLQRGTGVVAFFFIVWHVFHMHGWIHVGWWENNVAKPLGGAEFDPHSVITAAQAIQASPLVLAVYIVGVTACVYHLADGLWTAGITWGVWASPRSQRAALIPCTAFGLILGFVGLAAVIAMYRLPVPLPAEARPSVAQSVSVRTLHEAEQSPAKLAPPNPLRPLSDGVKRQAGQ
jgi:succinate dehydrogenase / fumarate reductase, cytochrome b subunit